MYHGLCTNKNPSCWQLRKIIKSRFKPWNKNQSPTVLILWSFSVGNNARPKEFFWQLRAMWFFWQCDFKFDPFCQVRSEKFNFSFHQISYWSMGYWWAYYHFFYIFSWIFIIFWGSNHCVLLYTKVKSMQTFVYRKVKASLKFVYKGQIKVVICIHFVYNSTHFF